MLGVVKDVPVPIDEPPVEAVYQLIVPADAVAPSVTIPGPQREFGVVPVMVGKGFTVIVITLEVTGLGIAHTAFDVIMQVT